MIESFFWILWTLWMAEALAAAVNAGLFGLLRRRQDRRLAEALDPELQRAVALIVPVKGFDPDLTPRFFRGLLSQQYRRYRLIVTMESDEDPVFAWLTDELKVDPESLKGSAAETLEKRESGPMDVSFVFAGECEGRGQKVHNQLAAFGELEEGDEIVAFADADIYCPPDWLARLVAPVNLGTHPVSSTYRWLIPRRNSPPNILASVINGSVASLGGWEAWNVLWGGSMAVARGTFDELDVPALFAGSLNDDLRLAKEVRSRGKPIAFVRSLMMPSPVDFTWEGLFEFGRRQYYQVRRFSPTLFKVAHLLTLVYTLGFLTALYAVGAMENFRAWVPIGFVTVCDQLRGYFRQRMQRTLFDDETAVVLARNAWIEHLATPVWMGLHALLVLSAWFVRTIRWAGIEYRVVSPGETVVVRRAPGADSDE